MNVAAFHLVSRRYRHCLTQAKASVAQVIIPELPRLPEGSAVESPGSATPPPPIEKDPVRSVSSSRHRPPLPPKDRRRSRGSTLQLVSHNPDLLAPPGTISARRSQRRHPHPIMNHLASLKHWLIESAKRAKSPGTRSDHATPKTPNSKSPTESRRSPASNEVRQASVATVKPLPQIHAQQMPHPRIVTSHSRPSISPGPLTPHSSYRRSSAGLRGRKSTSSSISSVRSIHHVHSHSKASSTSSTSNSVNSSAINIRSSRSPHTSLKVLPATPTTSSFPSNIRVVRTVPSPINVQYNEVASFGGLASPGLTFAKRKKTPFRGPMLHLDRGSGSPMGRSRDSGPGSRSTSVGGGGRRRSGETIAEEDEDEVEEVESFSPIVATAGVQVEETILESNGIEDWRRE